MASSDVVGRHLIVQGFEVQQVRNCLKSKSLVEPMLHLEVEVGWMNALRV